MSAIATLFRSLRRDWKLRQNRKARERRYVRNSPLPDCRDWSGAFLKSLKP